jgi:DNA (cytosine-5)-methyltransferase 1
MPTFYEFFAGGGMARAGLGSSWRCLFANDFDHKKSAAYSRNWGDREILTADIKNLTVENLPGQANLVWASFPCQDLSLAGGGAGLRGDRSGTFWPFWNLVKNLVKDNRAPDIVVLENVCGTLTSHNGKDFAAICEAFSYSGYSFGALVMDAALFVPQSRPRLFVVGIRKGLPIPKSLASNEAHAIWHTKALRTAYEKLNTETQKNWMWWNFQAPKTRKQQFEDILEINPQSVEWHTAVETKQLLSMMSDINRDKVLSAKRSGKRIVGTIYKRTRINENGTKVQRAEVRFDNIAGCLRTPAGGSSRQSIIIVDGANIKSRLISSRETARLMGLPDSYQLPGNYNEAYHLTGDGVAVPVVRHLAENLLEPLLTGQKRSSRKAA